MKITMRLSDYHIVKNGNDSESEDHPTEDLVLMAEILQPNYDTLSVQAVYLMDAVPADKIVTIPPAPSMPAGDLKARLFKTRLEGDSVLKLSLVRKKELSGVGKIFEQIVGFAAGELPIVGGIASGLIDFPDSWQHVLGEATLLIRPETPRPAEGADTPDGILYRDDLQSGSITTHFDITDQVMKNLTKLYEGREMDRRTRRWVTRSRQNIDRFLANSQHNGFLRFAVDIRD